MTDNKPNTLPYALRDKKQVKPDESFCFACHSKIPCFTDCCADINIFLTPLDVLRLSRRVGLSTDSFLDRHTLMPITKDLHLPVVLLRMSDNEKKTCPFVGEDGCTVYDSRPWSCRMYPLGMAIPPARAGETPKPLYFLFQDSFCRGHAEKQTWTVESYRNNQKVPEQEEIESGYTEIVSHPWFIGGRQLDPKRIEMFHMACYNLDKFRQFVFESSFLDRFDLEPEIIEKMRTDDTALLQFAFRWLRFALFAEPTLVARNPASTKTRREP